MAERFKLAPTATASSWDNLFWSQWNAAKRARGTGNAPDGTLAPRMTNREAVATIVAWRALDAMSTPGGQAWPLWYQFAAAAYGWDPVKSDRLNKSPAQADKLYPIALTSELWLALQRIAASLEARDVADPRVTLESSAWDDELVQGEVRHALVQDGASVSTLPSPTDVLCTDKETGKRRVKRPPCDADGKGPKWLNPVTGKLEELPCDKPGDCKPIPRRRVSTATMVVVGLAALALWYRSRPTRVRIVGGARNSARSRPIARSRLRRMR
jgi:hypothetical protein